MKSENIFIASEEDFASTVIARSMEHPVLVDFWAEWCPPCRTLNPVLEKIAAKKPADLFLAKVEVDENMHLVGHYKLTGFPSVLLFVNGEEVGRFAGAKSESNVNAFLASCMEQVGANRE